MEEQDHAIGIEEENIPKYLIDFFKWINPRTEEAGAGLGLAIANWIIDKDSSWQSKSAKQSWSGNMF